MLSALQATLARTGQGSTASQKGAPPAGACGALPTRVWRPGSSGTGIALNAGGSGRLLRFLMTFRWRAHHGGTYSAGEQIRDASGNLFICVAGGSPGTWLKVAAVAAGSGWYGQSAVRTHSPARYAPSGSGSLSAGSAYILQVTGVDVGGISVPKGATGVVGNVTVVQPNARWRPAPLSGRRALAWHQLDQLRQRPGHRQRRNVGLNTGGQISIKVDMPAGTATHVIFDASGYVM